MDLPNNFIIQELENISELDPAQINDLKYNCGMAVIGSLNSMARNGLPVYAVCSDPDSISLLTDIGTYEKEKLSDSVFIVTELPETLPEKHNIVNLTPYY